MTRLPGLSQWFGRVANHLPRLTCSQAWGLTLWSMGIVRAQHVGFLMGLVMLASIPDRTIATTRRCLRDRSLNGADKQGARHGHKRRTLTATTCVALLLRWVAALHPTDTCPLALAKDAAPTVHRLLRPCGHPRMCDPGGREDRARDRPRRTASVPGSARHAPRIPHANWMDGDRAGRSWSVRPTARCSHHHERMTPGSAHQPLRQEPSGGRHSVLDTPDHRGQGRPRPERSGVCLSIAALAMTRGGWHGEQTGMTDPARAERMLGGVGPVHRGGGERGRLRRSDHSRSGTG